MNYNVRIKAGGEIYETIKDGGFHPDRIASFFAPAGGPRWLAASGFDLALMKSGILGRKKPVLLAGSSAGAMRFSAWLQPEPEESYRRLMDAYISMPFGRKDTPATVFDSLSAVVGSYIEEDALPFALAGKRYRLAIITARGRNLLSSDLGFVQRTGLALAFCMNFFDRSYLGLFLERVVFYSGAKPPEFCFRKGFSGRFIALNEINFRYVLLASAAIPLVVSGVRDIYGAPRGVYRDGGLLDYHLSHRYSAGAGEITLFFHHQERIIPGWLDKGLKLRRPPAESLGNVLMVYPSETFMEKLPGGRIPDRTDFVTFLDDPVKRMENWRKTAAQSVVLGEEFLELIESGRIGRVVERLA